MLDHPKIDDVRVERERLLQLARSKGLERKTEVSSPTIKSVERGAGEIPLSFAQQRLWFLSRFPGASQAYHIACGLRLSGVLDRAALARALDRIVERHEALRTAFPQLGGEPVQHIAPGNVGFALIDHDLRDHAEPEAELMRLAAEEVTSPFDIEHGPLIRGRLVRMATDDHVLLVTMHHIVSDGWSMGILTAELSTLYGAYSRGMDDPLPPLSIQYGDYASWQRRWLKGEVLVRQSGYWKRSLSGAPVLLELPWDRPRPMVQDYAGAMIPVRLDAGLTSALKTLSWRHGMTLYMTLLTGWAILLSRLSGQQEVMIGSPTANRRRAEVEALIGFFVNTLALRIDLSDSPSVAELLTRVKTQVLMAQENQDLPFEQVVELVKPPRSLSYSPLFQAALTWENTPKGRLDLGGLRLSPMQMPRSTAQFDLLLVLAEEDVGEVAGGLEYAVALFDPETVERWLGYWVRVLEGMVADDRRSVSRIPLLDEAERHQVLVEWNPTAAAYPHDQCVHELFEAQVERTPEAIAVVHEGRRLSYAELNAQANRLAHHLRERGVKPDDRIAICAERGLEMVVALLAILKSGGAYVPLDPAYPPDRLAFMLEDSAPVALLTQGHLAAALPADAAGLPVIALDTDAAQWAGARSCNPNGIGLRPDHLAYIIYTSGSTGLPKGVMVAHRNVSRLFTATEQWFHFGPDDVWTLFHSYAFDFSVWEFWGALIYGGRLVVVSLTTARAPDEFYRLLCREGVTVLNQTPSAFRQLVAVQAAAAEVHSLRYVIFGGEALDLPALKPWYDRDSNQGTMLVNMYGITETTVHVTYRLLDAVAAARNGASSIGRPIPDLRVYILDAHGAPSPIGVAGEIHVGGAGVTLGYLNRPELTAERFVPDPFCGTAGGRMYRAGDLGRWRADGTIEFLGRNDFQVKVRGFRIELGEIEARLCAHDGVREAVVIAREDGPGDKRLVAYYVGDDGLGAEQLRGHLQSGLPDYMVPAAYVRLERLPLTPNGKLDRKGLPAPEGEAYAARAYEAPQGATEVRLAGIWAELLGVERVGRHDNFFELGGHSLLAVTLIERIRRAGLEADIRTLFATPSLAALAAVAVWSGDAAVLEPANLIPAGCERITPEMLPLVRLSADEIAHVAAAVPGGCANIQDIYPLAPLQEGILFHHLMGGSGDAYLLTSLLSFDGRARLDGFVSALNAVIARHDILRTAVLWEGLPEPVQVVWRQAAVAVEEVELDPAAGEASSQLQARFDPRHCRLDVRQAPLLRAIVARDPRSGHWLLQLLLHHLAIDHTTLAIVLDEIEAHVAGESARLPAPVPFRRFVAQARLGVSAAEHEAFFRRMLGDIEEPTAPFGLADVQGDGSGIAEVRQELPAELSRRLRGCARALGVSAASLFHLAWGQVLARSCGRGDVVFGTVLFGRMQGGEGSDRTLGMFINTLPLRLRIDDAGAADAVRAVQGLLAELLRHEHAPLVLAQRCSGVPAPAPLFSSLFDFRHSADGDVQDRVAWEGVEILHAEERTNYPLSLSVDDLGDGFTLTAQVQHAVAPERVCAFMVTALSGLAAALEGAPATAVRRIDVLPAAERARVLEEWNATAAAYPHDQCVHELFEAQVERTPEAIAVVHEGRRLSYAELNAQANRLAHHLRERGVKPDDRIAICAERGLEMVVGLLAILKSGGAYVPLDPGYPPDRLAFMLEDSAPVALLTQGHLAAALPAGAAGLPVIALDADAARWAEQSARNPDRDRIGLQPGHLAYVIYTSGSTGRPKGVMIEHRSLCNYALDAAKLFGLDACDVVLQQNSLNFDLSIEEMFFPRWCRALRYCLGPVFSVTWRQRAAPPRVRMWCT
ncbi:amino acid adenylation domain-containing protein [Bradyrhizobium sp. USDA 4369]